MVGLRLRKLPDRTPVKMAISVPPDLHQALHDYAALYTDTYGNSEPVHELVPAILTDFLDSDREFARFRRARGIKP